LGASTLLVLLVGSFFGLARAYADCYFFAKGGFVPAYNRGECEMVSGATSAEAKKEGIERCKDVSKGEVLAEFKWKDGQRVNGWFTDYNHNRVEYTLQGKIAQGAAKVVGPLSAPRHCANGLSGWASLGRASPRCVRVELLY
jgi:hypothetical protein